MQMCSKRKDRIKKRKFWMRCDIKENFIERQEDHGQRFSSFDIKIEIKVHVCFPVNYNRISIENY